MIVGKVRVIKSFIQNKTFHPITIIALIPDNALFIKTNYNAVKGDKPRSFLWLDIIDPTSVMVVKRV